MSGKETIDSLSLWGWFSVEACRTLNINSSLIVHNSFTFHLLICNDFRWFLSYKVCNSLSSSCGLQTSQNFIKCTDSRVDNVSFFKPPHAVVLISDKTLFLMFHLQREKSIILWEIHYDIICIHFRNHLYGSVFLFWVTINRLSKIFTFII